MQQQRMHGTQKALLTLAMGRGTFMQVVCLPRVKCGTEVTVRPRAAGLMAERRGNR